MALPVDPGSVAPVDLVCALNGWATRYSTSRLRSAPISPTGFPTATPMSLEDYTKFLTLRRQDVAFDPLAKLMFGKDIFAIADEWYRLTPSEQVAWQQQEEAKYTLLLRYLGWLTRVEDSARATASIPVGSNPTSRPPAPSPRPSRG